MNQMAMMLLGTAAIADIALIAHLRSRQLRTAKYERMMKCLRTALLRDGGGEFLKTQG